MPTGLPDGQNDDALRARPDPAPLCPAEDCGEFSLTSAAWETQLIRRIAGGDCEAFELLHARYAKPLQTFAVRILNDAHETEDVLQEVFFKIWEQAPAYDETAGKPFSWAVTITRFRSIDRLRTRKRRLKLFAELPDLADATETEGVTQSLEATRGDQAADLGTAMDALPNLMRRPIELAFFGGLTHPEIAASLEQPLGTIKARIRRGILRLRDGLADREMAHCGFVSLPAERPRERGTPAPPNRSLRSRPRHGENTP